MSKPEIDSNSNPPSRKKWLWILCGAFSFALIIFAISIPFIQNYRTIKKLQVLGGGPGAVKTESGLFLKLLPPSWEKWLENHLEAEYFLPFENITLVSMFMSPVKDSDLIHIRGLVKLERLHFDRTEITGSGLIHLRNLVNLKELEILDADLSGDSLIHLKNLKKLHDLDLSGSKITNSSLVHLENLKQLRYLDLTSTQVTDDELVHFRNLKELKGLWLYATKVTPKGVEQLQAELPDCSIGVSDPKTPNQFY